MIATSAQDGFKRRNSHMRGVTSTLRLLLERETGDDEAGECLFDAHIFDGFALVNYLLCTALKDPRRKESLGGGKRYSSPIMRHNCAHHFLRTMEILEPTVIVVHGRTLRDKWLPKAKALQLTKERKTTETVKIAGRPVDLLTFNHPSAGGNSAWWGRSPHSPYLKEAVAPAIKTFLTQRGISIYCFFDKSFPI